MGDHPYFPLFVDLWEKTVVIVGGGTVAARRAAVLAEFTPGITIIAPAVHPQLQALASQGRLRVLLRAYAPGDLTGADLVLAATDDPQVNQAVVQHCRTQGIPVNHAGDKTQCDFFFPGIARQAHLVVGVTAGGKDHRQARRLTERIKKLLQGLPGVERGEPKE